VETEEDERGLAVFLHAIEQVQAMDRQDVRRRTAEEFDNDRIADRLIAPLAEVRAELTSASILSTQASQPAPQSTQTEADSVFTGHDGQRAGLPPRPPPPS